MPATDPIDEILAPLGSDQRGFVLGLLLARGQQQREEVARTLVGAPGISCSAAVRAANGLPREGRLLLIQRLAGEIVGLGRPPDETDFGDRIRAVLKEESDGILDVLAQSGPEDPIAAAAQSELHARGAPTATGRSSSHEVRVELRRAVAAAAGRFKNASARVEPS